MSVTLLNCDQEPIHIPGAIQPHGALLVFDRDERIVAFSRNAAERLGLDCDDLFGWTPIQLGLPSRWLRGLRGRERRTLTDTRLGPYDIHVHGSDDNLVLVELEPEEAIGTRMTDVLVAIQGLHLQSEVDELCDSAARHIQRLTGYDRVMVYRFDTDDHGEVVAEATGEGTDPRFLGQHFPEADIPSQARRLYLRQVARLIVDVDYEPCPILSRQSAPIDLSDAHLRSVSPIHCDYLRNMGVGATFTLSILVDGRLWGLVACHHHTPRAIGFATRSAAVLTLEVFANRLASLVRHRRAEATRVAQRRLVPITERLRAGGDLRLAVADALGELALLVGADGALLHDGIERRRTGSLPPGDLLEGALAAIADQADPVEVWQTDRLHVHLPELREAERVARGALALPPIAGIGRLVFFRDERVVHRPYGRKPIKPDIHVRDGVPRLSPQGSFNLFLEKVRHQSAPWSEGDRAVAQRLLRVLKDALAHHSATLEARNLQLEEADKAKDSFLAMLSHELRNPLNAIVGWSSLLNRSRLTPEQQREAFAAIHRNAQVQQRLIDDLLDVTRIANGKIDLKLEVLQLEDCLESAVEATHHLFEARRIDLQVRRGTCGPVEGDAERIQQIMWNLLGNASKYTPEGGHVVVRLYPQSSRAIFEVEDDGVGIPEDQLAHLFTRFHRVPQHARHAAGGLGLGLSIVDGLARLHNATVEVFSQVGQGSTFRVSFPMSASPRGMVTPTPAQAAIRLDGARVVLVDDEPDAVAFLRLLLVQAGADVTAFSSPAEAFEHLADPERAVDILVSDVNMHPFDGYELARRTRDLEHRRGLPMVAVTAYAGAQDRVAAYRAGFAGHVAKPVNAEEFLAILASHAPTTPPAPREG